jgi:TRAP-type C4-dicarboxylate transport system permease small subunit
MKRSKQRGQEQKVTVMDQYQIFHYLDRINAHIETVLNVLGVTFIIILMFFTACEILGRYLFNNPIPGYVEDTELIMAAIVFLGIGYTQRVGGHIRMDMFIQKMKGRTYHITEALSLFLSLIAYGIICIYSLRFTVEAYQMGDVTEYLYTPTWPSKLCVPLGSFFLCTRIIIQIIKNLAQAVVGAEVRELE